MQSRDGGWAAFDVNNLEYYLNNIPFSDHGALLDPPTEDVTARCVSLLAQLGETVQSSKAVAEGVAYLRRTQLAEGSWYGRWGLNYIYGTWSVLCALNAAGVDHQDPVIRKAAAGCCRSRTRTAAGARMPPATGSTTRDLRGLHHRLANGMGLAWADGWRARSGIPRSRGGVEYLKAHRPKRASGTSSATRQRAFRGYFICVIMAIRSSFRSGVGAVSKFEEHQQQGGRGRNVNLGAGKTRARAIRLIRGRC